MTREHFLNAEFDLSLRPGWTGVGGPKAAQQVRDLALQAVVAAGGEESVVLYEPLPADFCDWLAGHGLQLPAVSVFPGRRDGSTLAPFGWNRVAADLDQRVAQRAPRPDLEVVRRANDRRFADQIAREVLDETDHVLGHATSAAEVAALLAADRGHDGGWVVKARHGNSALGNRRLRWPGLDEAAGRMLTRLLAADPVVTVERWRQRVLDLTATFEVDPAGGVRDAAVHEVVNTAAGAFLGAVFEPRNRRLERWRDTLLATVATVGGAAAAAGYFGPACIDAFVWRDRAQLRLRRLVELNARRSMSAGFRRLADRWGGRRSVCGRLVSLRRLRLPDDYRALDDALGEDRFDLDRGHGVLATSPLWLGPERRRPHRAGIVFVASGRRDALAMVARFRHRFEERG